MKRFFLDTNIVLDYLLKREPFALLAKQLFAAADANQVQLLVASLSFTTAHYIGRQPLGKHTILSALESLRQQVTIVNVGSFEIAQAIQAGLPDFEDAVQFFAALAAGADAIVTRDPKGFPTQQVPVLSPLAALSLI